MAFLADTLTTGAEEEMAFLADLVAGYANTLTTGAEEECPIEGNKLQATTGASASRATTNTQWCRTVPGDLSEMPRPTTTCRRHRLTIEEKETAPTHSDVSVDSPWRLCFPDYRFVIRNPPIDESGKRRARHKHDARNFHIVLDSSPANVLLPLPTRCRW